MVVPDFWAEGRAQSRAGGKQVTVRRLGWSMRSVQGAQDVADQRANEAPGRALAGEAIKRRERKLPFGAGDGSPILEELVSRHGDEVITRNGYGALCLNAPRTLFANVDLDLDLDRLDQPPSHGLTFLVVAVLGGAVAPRWLGNPKDPRALGLVIGMGALIAAFLWVTWRLMLWRRRRPSLFARIRAQAIARVEGLVVAHPGWGVRVYDTPADLRLQATRRAYEASDPEVNAFFVALGDDPQYVALCRVQQCFQARLTGKPWRMRVGGRPGAWPSALAQQAARADWLRRYDTEAAQFAACRWARTLGSTLISPHVAPVVDLHDDQTRALRT